MKKTTDSNAGLWVGLAGLALAGYYLLKPSDAAASSTTSTTTTTTTTTPNPPTPQPQPPAPPTPTPGVSQPTLTFLGSGTGAPGIAPIAGVSLGVNLLPAASLVYNDANGNYTPLQPSDVLVYIQGYFGTEPVFPDPSGVVPIAAVLTGAGAAAQSLDINALLDGTKGALKNYVDPAVAAKLEVPGTVTVVWTTTGQGNTIAWWLMRWSP